MFEIISQINNLARRVGKLESLETPFKSYGLWANRPTVPFSGQRFFATDRSIDYFWDGTRWLSVQKFALPFVSRGTQPFAQGPTSFDLNFSEYDQGGGIYIYALNASFFPSSVQSATNFYSLTLVTVDTSGVATAITLGGTADTKTFTTASRWYALAPTLTPAVITTHTAIQAAIQFTPTLNPGTFFGNASLGYRLIG